jgi:hypothetical protein
MESKEGFLAPRVTLTSLASVSLSGQYQPVCWSIIAGSLTYGYYYWDGSEWKKLDNGNENLVSKTADATLLKAETIVLGSNDIVLTLPAVTSADNGLSITVKNNGSHTDLVTVKGNGSATINGRDSSNLTRHAGQTFIASGSNWEIKNKKPGSDNILDVNAGSSWTTIQEVLEYLDAHMTGPTVIRLSDESYEVDATIDVDLPFTLTFQGIYTELQPLLLQSDSPAAQCSGACLIAISKC